MTGRYWAWCCASSCASLNQACNPSAAGAAQVAKANEAALHIGAVAFIHRFGSSLNEHVTVVAQAQADLRRRILRAFVAFVAFVGPGLIERCDAKEMLAYQHSGTS